MIKELRQKRLLWFANEQKIEKELVPTGYLEFDQILGGLPESGVIEIQSRPGSGEFRLLLNYLKHNEGMICLIQNHSFINAEFLLQKNIDPNSVLIIQPKNQKDALWAAEQCLKSGLYSNVLLWDCILDFQSVRRLNLACEQKGACLLLLNSNFNTFTLGSKLSLTIQPDATRLKVRVNKSKGKVPTRLIDINFQHHWPKFYRQSKHPSNDTKIYSLNS